MLVIPFSRSVSASALCSVLSLLTLTKAILAVDLRPPAPEFSRHKTFRPNVYHSRERREIFSTKNSNGAHHAELTVTVNIDKVDYVLDLRLNEDLVPDNHIIKYQENGKTVLHRPQREDMDICQYSGKVRGYENSWVALSTCNGIRGIIYDGKKLQYIEPAHNSGLQSVHYMYDHADLTKTHHCGYVGGVTNNTSFDRDLHTEFTKDKKNGLTKLSRLKRSIEEASLHGPYNANKLSRYVELVLVADNREYKANGENIQLVHSQMKDVANIINSLYAPLNIFIALVGVVVWTENDEIVLEENGDTTLTNFLHYRKKRLSIDIPNDNAQLLTRQKFKDGVVGKALKGPICTYEFSGGVNTNHSEVLGLVATTIAHEMGHNFGMEHDNEEDCECPDEKCIMSPSSTSITPIHWSSCSLKALALAFERGMDYCLRNKPAKLFDSPTCGNGFVEPGEQCDCGTLNDPKARSACHLCCHPDTCMLRSNATCATGPCCDLSTCRPKAAGTVCRSADQECDLPEYCSGYSEFCPKDVYKMDSMLCDKEKAYCYHGSCRSHTDQCRLLWGTTGQRSHDNCYTSMNIKGTKNGNCGYDRLRQLYKVCSVEDSLCGLLHCRHLNEQLEFGMESVAFLSHTFINNNGVIIPCRTAIIDLGLNQVDPGLVPDGAKCGDNMMCLSQKCVKIETVEKNISVKTTSVCPSDCSGHGVCNSEGHCHCERGFAPPLCALPGPGGSVDSGPATDPSIQKNFMVAMYVIFLGIIPTIVLLMFLFYYMKNNNLIDCIRLKKTKQMVSPKKGSLQRRLSRGASKFAANFQCPHPQSQTPQANVHTLSPDDMSSSLLRSDSDHSSSGNVNPTATFFGQFTGFTLAPIEKTQANKKNTEDKTSNMTNVGNDQINVKTIADNINANKSAKITPVNRSNSNIQNSTVVSKPVLRTAPPLPTVPTIKPNSPKTSPIVKRTNSVQDRIKALIGTDKTDNVISVTNPPLRPVISSPILEASTCTAKELVSPLQGSKTLGPLRAAPTLPGLTPDLPKRPLSMHAPSNVLEKPLPEEPKKVKEGLSLNRIASFLKQEKPKEKERNPVERSHSLPKNSNQNKIPKAIDKATLRNLQISNPILQKEIELPINTVPVISDPEDMDEPKSFVNRTQSMRGPAVAQRPAIHSFGSMRQPSGVTRPVSVAGRPTAPPPPLPNQQIGTAQRDNVITEISVYQNPKPQPLKPDYVDCIGEKQAPLANIDEETSSDNIYAIIEESPVKHPNIPGDVPPIKTVPQTPPDGYNAPKAITSNSGSTESLGLLGEIVNEIQNRNLDSIYSASTLSRKKKGKENEKKEDRDSTYMNADHYRTPESVYSNTDSTTSSGYLHPSAVNVPTYYNKVEHPNIDTKTEEKTPPSPKGNSKIPTFSRQITPPGLKNTTTFRSVPPSPKTAAKNTVQKLANSPDVVSSCSVADTKPSKPPDIINNNKNDATKLKAKPADNRPPLRPAPIKNAPTLKPVNPINAVKIHKTDSVKTIADNINKNKPKTVPKPVILQRTDSSVKPNATKVTTRPSNVASLQQKFENRKSTGRETTVKK